MRFKVNNLTWEINVATKEQMQIQSSESSNGSKNNLPRIYIGDKRVLKTWSKPRPNPVPADDPDPCGVTFRSLLQIFINDSLNDDLFRRTIDHEITHAFTWSYGLTQFTDFSEENLCDFVETHAREIIKVSDRAYNTLIKQKHNKDKLRDKLDK